MPLTVPTWPIPPMSANKACFSVWLPIGMKEALWALARAQHRPLRAVIIQALQTQLDKEVVRRQELE